MPEVVLSRPSSLPTEEPDTPAQSFHLGLRLLVAGMVQTGDVCPGLCQADGQRLPQTSADTRDQRDLIV